MSMATYNVSHSCAQAASTFASCTATVRRRAQTSNFAALGAASMHAFSTSAPCLDFLAPAWIGLEHNYGTDIVDGRSKTRPGSGGTQPGGPRRHTILQQSRLLSQSPRRQHYSTEQLHQRRGFSSTSLRLSSAPTPSSSFNPATTAPPPPLPISQKAAPTRVLTNPRHDEQGNIMTITITPRAAHRLQAIAATDANPDLALRVTVESGGCHGFQYLMNLTSVAEMNAEEDSLFECETRVGKGGGAEEGVEGYKAKVLMDEPSLELLKGSSVDYTMELIGSQFKVTGIPGAKSSCGCGTSFDIS